MRRLGVKDAVRPHRNGQRENRLTGPCSGRALPGGQRRRRNPLMPDRPAELYGFAASVYVRSVRLALEEKRLPYTLHEVDPFQPGGPPDWYLALHPFGQIPALRDGDLVLFEWDRSEERRCGEEVCRHWRTRWSPYP